MNYLITFCIYAVMVLGIFVLTGCATTRPAPETVMVTVPCLDNKTLPEPPARGLELDAKKPGEAVQAVLANRLRWIGYADALAEHVENCK